MSFGPAGTAVFADQIAISGVTPTPVFSQGGDSGSLILSEQGKHPVGLLFAGGSGVTFANKIGRVLGAFGATIVG